MCKWLGLLLAGSLAGGCSIDRAKLVSASSLGRLKPRPPEVAPDVVDLQYIFIERPAGNELLNKQIWDEADEQAVALDLKSHLQENGLRFGKLGAHLSPAMLTLLKSANSRGEGTRLRCRSGGVGKVQLTEILPQWSLFTVADGDPRGEQLTAAQGYLSITPALAEADAILVSIMPQVEHGLRQSKRVPAPDLSGWQIRNERDLHRFADLKVELELASGEFALIGCWPDRAGTLGHQLFTKTASGERVQTVLLIRAVRPTRDELYTAGYDADDLVRSPLIERGGRRRSLVRETLLAARRR